MQVSEQDRYSSRRPKTNGSALICEYQRLVFGAKSSPTFSNYALKRVGLGNEEEAAMAIQSNI